MRSTIRLRDPYEETYLSRFLESAKARILKKKLGLIAAINGPEIFEDFTLQFRDWMERWLSHLAEGLTQGRGLNLKANLKILPN